MFNRRVFKRSYRMTLCRNGYDAMIRDAITVPFQDINPMDTVSIVILDEDYDFRPIFHQCFKQDFCINVVINLIEEEIGTTWFESNQIYKDVICEIAIKRQ